MRERTFSDRRVGLRIIREWSDGEQEELTPICLHCQRSKLSFDPSDPRSLNNCRKRSEVFYCSGQVIDCDDYKVERTLFD